MQQFQRYFIADSKQLLILIYFSHEMINLFSLLSQQSAVSMLTSGIITCCVVQSSLLGRGPPAVFTAGHRSGRDEQHRRAEGLHSVS